MRIDGGAKAFRAFHGARPTQHAAFWSLDIDPISRVTAFLGNFLEVSLILFRIAISDFVALATVTDRVRFPPSPSHGAFFGQFGHCSLSPNCLATSGGVTSQAFTTGIKCKQSVGLRCQASRISGGT